MNKPAQLNLYSLSAYVPYDGVMSDEVACGFVLAAYDEEDARDEVREFVGESTSITRFDPVLTIGLAELDIEHGMIMSHIPDFL
tara:strand:- start:82 stop:333 length:252 start_codon:yes stop_codon:yes gene_type:complete